MRETAERMMAVNPNAIATIAPAFPLPVPKPPVELAICKAASVTQMSAAIPAIIILFRLFGDAKFLEERKYLILKIKLVRPSKPISIDSNRPAVKPLFTVVPCAAVVVTAITVNKNKVIIFILCFNTAD